MTLARLLLWHSTIGISCTRAFAGAAALLALLAACRSAGQKAPAANTALRAQLAAEATHTFQSAVYLKPNPDTARSDLLELAPLIVHELDISAGESAQPAILLDAEIWFRGKTARTALSVPTVYAAARTVRIRDRAYRQVCYLWLNKAEEGADGRIITLGIVITNDRGGFPIIVETLSSERAERPLFVSRTLEQESRQAFGAPLPQRAYTIEPAVGRLPSILVVGLFDDAPVPMGPYVYVNRRHECSTVLCRCSASQVEEFAHEARYEIRALRELCSDRSRAEVLGVHCTANGTAWPADHDRDILSSLRMP